MPYPHNIETAEEVEATILAAGAVPATIAIIAGVPHVGEFIKFLMHANSK